MTQRSGQPTNRQAIVEGIVTEKAWPKVNLTLRVIGERPDGYHEIESLVAFARDVADVVTLTPGHGTPRITTTGPFAAGIAGPNLIAVTLDTVARAAPQIVLGDVALTKNMPIAAGIGGGSADAAAVLRALRSVNSAHAASVDWQAIAARLGADVPVCVLAQPQVMRGIGERLESRTHLPQLAVVLVNPMVPVPADKTAQVFRALAAARVGQQTISPITPQHFEMRDHLVAHMRSTGNDLLAPARSLVPAIDQVLTVMEACAGCELAQLSGGGPTCFGVFPDMTIAEAAAATLQRTHPGWWIVATRL